MRTARSPPLPASSQLPDSASGMVLEPSDHLVCPLHARAWSFFTSLGSHGDHAVGAQRRGAACAHSPTPSLQGRYGCLPPAVRLSPQLSSCHSSCPPSSRSFGWSSPAYFKASVAQIGLEWNNFEVEPFPKRCVFVPSIALYVNFPVLK